MTYAPSANPVPSFKRDDGMLRGYIFQLSIVTLYLQLHQLRGIGDEMSLN